MVSLVVTRAVQRTAQTDKTAELVDSRFKTSIRHRFLGGENRVYLAGWLFAQKKFCKAADQLYHYYIVNVYG